MFAYLNPRWYSKGGGGEKRHAILTENRSHKGKCFVITLAVTFLTLFSIFCFITSCTSTSAKVLKSTVNFLFFSPSFFSSISNWKRASCCLHARAMLAAFSETWSSSRRISDISEPCFSVAAVGGIGTYPLLSAGKIQECERESSSESDVSQPGQRGCTARVQSGAEVGFQLFEWTTVQQLINSNARMHCFVHSQL